MPSPDLPTDAEAALTELGERCKEAGRKFEILPAPHHITGYPAVRIAFPQGRNERSITFQGHDQLQTLLDNRFEDVIFLRDLSAFTNIETGIFEAGLNTPRRGPRLQDLPGVEMIDEDNQDPPEAYRYGRRQAQAWQLTIDHPTSTASIRLGSASALASLLLRTVDTLQISGVKTASHDESVRTLEDTVHRLAFDLDVVFNIHIHLARPRPTRPQPAPEAPVRPVSYPRNDYAREAVQLYLYGRRSEGLPLLEFLGYYQAVEYFFPFFAQEQTVNDMRAALLHPAFNPGDDRQIGRLIGLATPGRITQSEKEQLRTTLRSCLAESDLIAFLEADQERQDAMTRKNQKIKGINALRLNDSHNDVREQIADRIYTIRCRIVHAKADGGYEDVLLPTGEEANALQADIDLLRYVAQQVLIARAART